MRKRISLFICFYPWIVPTWGQDRLVQYLNHLNRLEFEKARLTASEVQDTLLGFELDQLAKINYHSGQIDKAVFVTAESKNSNSPTISILRALNRGYLSLFYDAVKGDAYKHFYNAYQQAREVDDPLLIKESLLAILRYHNFEIAQNSNAYVPYLNHFETLANESVDQVWLTLFKMIFYSKSLTTLDSNYFALADQLTYFENTLDQSSPLLVHVFYEKALMYDIEKKTPEAVLYYSKVVEKSADFPFLKYHRFFALLKLMMIEMRSRNFESANRYLNEAKQEINLADSLRSNYYLNLYGAFLLHEQNNNDSAFNLLWQAYVQEFQLDFRRNTLEINRLTVELETQEKENANLRLRQGRMWFMSASVAFGLLSLATYLAYLNQRKAKQVQSMKMEKLLKDQEVLTIDSMIEGQEKERQRIADDLHDNLGSLLATLKFNLSSLKTKKDRVESEKEELIERTDLLIDEAYQKVRAIAHAGNVGVNAKDGLLPAIRKFVSKVSILNQLSIEVEEHGMDDRLDSGLEIMIFRIVQELITNVIKHAEATEVVISLTRYEESINLMVEDNGVGFSTSQVKPEETMGLHSIQKKIESLGGRVAIESVLKKGTSIIIDIPLPV